MLTSLGKAASVDELDEMYVRAEGSFDGGDLEQLLVVLFSLGSAY